MKTESLTYQTVVLHTDFVTNLLQFITFTSQHVTLMRFSLTRFTLDDWCGELRSLYSNMLAAR